MTDREKVIKGLCEMSYRATWKDIDKIRDKFQPIVNDAILLLKEPKESKWIDHLYRFNDTRFECKSCHRTAAKSYQFCPWCGLKMTGTEIDKDFSEGAGK